MNIINAKDIQQPYLKVLIYSLLKVLANVQLSHVHNSTKQ